MTHYPEHSPMRLDVEGGYYSRHVDAMTREGLHSKSDIAAQLGARDREIDQLKAALLDLGRARTPSSQWAAKGEPDPHGDRYACDRATLAMGNLTDDEMANAVFMHGNEQPSVADLISGKAFLPIAYLTAAKDRIRWLSRALVAAQAATGKQQVGEAQGVGITADWVLGYLNTDAPEDSRDAIRNAFTEWNTLDANQPVGQVPVGTVVGGEFHYLTPKHGLPEGSGLYATLPAADPAERSRSEAWSEVYKTLREVCPDLMDHSSVGLQNALHAIRTLAANRTATQPPLGYRWRHSANERWQYSDVPCGWQYEPVYAQPVDLGQFRVQVAELLRSEFDLEVADPEDHRHDDGQERAERLAARIAALIDKGEG